MQKTLPKELPYRAQQGYSRKKGGKIGIDPSAQDKIIREYAQKVKFMAYRLSYRLQPNIDIDDLISSGVIGLMDAMEKYDPSRETLFKTYAEFRIRGAMLDEIRSMDWIPRSVKEKAGLLHRTMAQLEKKLGRAPQEEELAKALSMTLEEYQEFTLRASGMAMISIEDLGGGEEGDRDILECIGEEEKRDPLTLLLSEDTKQVLVGAIEALPEKERKVVSLYYYNELTMKEIGKVLNVTESRVSQIHTQAMMRLQGKLRIWKEEHGQ
ncbi:MAG: FliA/WhiG family RNA polymerase sigma factor [Nitrospirae bacterium]|nr:FliA/WhiG family RNA polymerase sigma factor [Nitrospirota bacterium]